MDVSAITGEGLGPEDRRRPSLQVWLYGQASEALAAWTRAEAGPRELSDETMVTALTILSRTAPAPQALQPWATAVLRAAGQWAERAPAADAVYRMGEVLGWPRALLSTANKVRHLCHDDPEPLGVIEEALARLHLEAGDPKRAAHYAKGLRAWVAGWRCPRDLIRIDALHADIEGSLDAADAAVTLARSRLSPLDLSEALQARARVLVRRGEVSAARAALHEALDAVRPEGLRPHMIHLHLLLAKLPEGDDRVSHAREALSLARLCRLIHDEAKACCALVALAPTPWDARTQGHFARAARIVRELGPPAMDAEIAALAARGTAHPSQ